MTPMAVRQRRLSVPACLLVLALLFVVITPSIPTSAASGDEFWDDRFGLPGLYEATVITIDSSADGDLYAAGSFSNASAKTFNNIAHWDGRRWNALGTGLTGGGFTRISKVAVAGDGTVYAVGDFSGAGNVAANGIARWNGSEWSLVGNGIGPKIKDQYGTTDGRIYTVAVGPDGVYIGGQFTHIDDVEVNGIARWDGNSWSALDRGVGSLDLDNNFSTANTEVYEIVFDGATLYAGGVFTVAGDALDANGVAAWNGTSWSALGAGLKSDGGFITSGDVRALAVLGGQLYAGGLFASADNKPANNIAVWNGTTWNAIGAGVSKEFATSPVVLDLLPVGNTLYVGGNFTRAGGQVISGLARVQGTTWSAAGSALEAYSDIEISGLAPAPNGALYVSGNFHSAEGGQVNNVALLNNGAWEALGQGVVTFGDTPADIRATTIDDAGRVFIGGQISFAGGVPVKGLAMWDGNYWYDIGGVDGGTVEALLAVGDDLFVAGSFTTAGGISAAHIARWNATSGQWFTLGTGINGAVNALTYADGVLYAGGNFTSAGSTAAFDVAAWDGANWSPLGGGYRIFELSQEGGEVGTSVYALAFAGGSLYIGGSFQTIQQGQSNNASSLVLVNNIVEWQRDTQQWYPLALHPNEEPGLSYDGESGFNIDVQALEVVGDSLYAGGRFNMAGGAVGASNLARWNINATDWQPIEGVGGLDDVTLQVHALASFGNDLFVGGAFVSAGPTQARYVGRFNTATNTWSTLGSGAKWYNDRFTEITSVAADANGVYVGGKFDQTGENKSFGFGRWAGPLSGGNNPPPPPPPGNFKVYLPTVRS